MASRKTWVWALVGVAGAGVVVLIAIAGAGLYFVSQHVLTQVTPGPEAIQAFDAVTGSFDQARPLYELNARREPRATRPLGDLPTARMRPTHLWVLAWNPENSKLVKVSLPFWILRLGPRKLKFSHGQTGFDLNRLDLDVDQLERIGPAIVFDYRDENGVRVLVWTQ